MDTIADKAEGKLAICLIVKNEARYLAEWIEYHLLIGVDKIYIYDNNSDDDLLSVCAAYRDVVQIYPWPSTDNQQRHAYIHFASRHGKEFDWCAFIDADEFMAYQGEGSLKSYLKSHDDKNGLLMGWRLFGTNGHQRRPAGLVVENYTKTHSVSPNPYWKTVCRAGRIDTEQIKTPHHFPYRDPAPVVPAAECQIVLYHYILRSVEDIVLKITRGDVWSKESSDKRMRNVQMAVQRYLEKYDNTDIEDRYLAGFAPLLRDRIASRSPQAGRQAPSVQRSEETPDFERVLGLIGTDLA